MSTQGRRRHNQAAKRGSGGTSGESSGSGDQSQEDVSNPLARLDESGKATLIAQFVEQSPGLLDRPELIRIAQVVQKSHSGPLPAPEDFAEYEKALPGSCDRILKMAEKQQDYVYEINKRRLNGDFSEARWGQVCAVLLGLVGIAACVFTAQIGADWRVSTGLGAGAVGLLIVPFLRRGK